MFELHDVIAPVNHELVHAVLVILQEFLMCLHFFRNRIRDAHLCLAVFIFFHSVHNDKRAVNRQTDKNFLHSELFLQAELLACEGLPCWGVGVVRKQAEVRPGCQPRDGD